MSNSTVKTNDMRYKPEVYRESNIYTITQYVHHKIMPDIVTWKSLRYKPQCCTYIFEIFCSFFKFHAKVTPDIHIYAHTVNYEFHWIISVNIILLRLNQLQNIIKYSIRKIDVKHFTTSLQILLEGTILIRGYNKIAFSEFVMKFTHWRHIVTSSTISTNNTWKINSRIFYDQWFQSFS